ncbi:MAG: hypothetical protein V4538_13945 [Bacteroidota bacterium]
MKKKYYSIILVFCIAFSACLKDTPDAWDNANKLSLGIAIVDAEYNQSSDKLYLLSASYPYELRIFNVNDNSFDKIRLNYPPNCISVVQNGKYAAVGHSNKITYIDLITKSIKREFDVSANIFDIVLYDSTNIIANTNNTDSIYWINTNTGKLVLESFGTTYYPSPIKLHPKGNYILGLTPYFYYKLNIANNKLVCLKSDSSNLNNLGFNFWFANNSSMIYSSFGGILLAGDSLTDKVNLISRLSSNLQSYQIYSAVESKRNQKIYTATKYTNLKVNSLACFDGVNYTLLNILPLKNILYPLNGKTELAVASPSYVFVNSTNDKIIVVAVGGLSSWGLEVLDAK